MAVIDVALGARSYPVIVEPGCVQQVGEWLAAARHDRVHVVSQTPVWLRHGAALTASLQRAGLWPGDEALTLVADGEDAKSWVSAGRVLDDLIARGLERGDAVIAFGGGVVGDLAGFAAATYLRGIAFVQVPTTLLAQVDASVGGKTGINHQRGKNLIGAFHQPAAVFADPELLRTLPGRDLRAGLAECIKHGLIRSEPYMRLIDEQLANILAADAEALTDLVAASVRIKAAVVAADERETGERATLNFGHTTAHAIEAVTEFSWRHGEAVAAGMIAALRLSEMLGLCDDALIARTEALLQAADLPANLPPVAADALLAAAGQDKKRRDGQLTWVLLREPGVTVLHHDVAEETVLAAWRAAGAT